MEKEKKTFSFTNIIIIMNFIIIMREEEFFKKIDADKEVQRKKER